MNKSRIIDTIGITYESMDELIERQQVIEDKLKEFIAEKGIADSYESRIETRKDGLYCLTIDLLSNSFEVEN